MLKVLSSNGIAGGDAKRYVPQDGLAGRAHQGVAEGLATGVVQILYGPAPGLTHLHGPVLPHLQTLKIQPGGHG